jgi:hypothetical protein
MISCYDANVIKQMWGVGFQAVKKPIEVEGILTFVNLPETTVTSNKSYSYLHWWVTDAFLRTQRHKNIGHKDTNLCLFNPIIFKPHMYVGHKNTNLQNVPPTFCKFMSGHIFDIFFHLPPQRAVPCHGEELHATAARRHRCLCRTLPLPAAATSLTTAARNRCTPYSAAAVADAFSNNNGQR